RDGLPARCVLLFNYQDVRIQEFFIDKIGEDAGSDGAPVNIVKLEQLKTHARDKLNLLLSYAKTRSCRRQMILDYFGDPGDVSDCHCDVCAPNGLHPQQVTIEIPEEVVTRVRQILSAIARLKGTFGVGAVAEVLAGEQTERTQRWRLNELSVWGLMRAC